MTHIQNIFLALLMVNSFSCDRTSTPGATGDMDAQAQLWADGELKPAPLGQEAVAAIVTQTTVFVLDD